jgi:hypothetical protein
MTCKPLDATDTVEIAVISPFAFVVMTGINELDPKTPVFEFTVANVVILLNPVLVTSPVIAAFVVTVDALPINDPIKEEAVNAPVEGIKLILVEDVLIL